MKRTLSLFLTLVMALGILTSVPVTVSAASVDVLTFSLNVDGNYTVSKCDESAVGEVVIPETYNGLPVTGIGNYSFGNCTGVTSVVIPDGVTRIFGSAFYKCTGLVDIKIPQSVIHIYEKAFYGCEKLKAVVIGNDVDEIEEETFYQCKNLESVVIGENVRYIHKRAFSGCQSLISLKIPRSVINIKENAFAGCRKLEKVEFGKGLEYIDDKAFYGCRSLTEIELPYNIQWIGNECFFDCDKLLFATIYNPKLGVEDWPLGYRENEEGWIVGVENFTICSIPGSNMELYAKQNHFKFVEDKHTHILSDWFIDSVVNCVNDGEKHKECTICGEMLEKETEEAFGHSLGDWIIDKEPTLYEYGERHKYCSVCKCDMNYERIPLLKCSKPKLKKIENTADGVKITWGKVEGADSYAIYRKTGSKGKYAKVGTATKTGFTDKKAKSGKKYYYYVKAVNEAGSSSASSSKSIYYLADTTLKTPKSTKSGVTLNWTQITGADGYMVYRKTGSGDYKKIATVKGVKKLKYTDKSAKKGKTYTYKIKAYKSKTYSAYSNAKKIKDKY